MTSHSEILSPENELICEKLLGWRKCSSFGAQCAGWTRPDSAAHSDNTPDFTTWAEAGLILDALIARDVDYELYVRAESGVVSLFPGELIKRTKFNGHVIAAIRAAAIEYIRSLP